MRLEAVVVCVNYSDFLAHTLPYNKQLFDRMIVVTDNKDEKTKKLCEYHNVECVQTDEFYRGSSIINKGRGINEGLKLLSKSDWVLHLDADIYLPPLTREILERIEPELDKKGLFTVDRMMCPTYQEWNKFVNSPQLLHEGWIFVHTNIFPMGVRIAEYKSAGWEPIGYFQMWHPKTSGIKEYPNEHGSVDRSDVIFTKNWSRGNRHLIPEIISIHLESEALNLSEMGKNWNGRKTKEFSALVNVEKKLPNNKLGFKFYFNQFINLFK